MPKVLGLNPNGGILEVTVSPNGDDQLTEIEVDPRARLIVLQTTALLRLQPRLFVGQSVGDPVDTTRSHRVFGGGNNRWGIAGWPDGVAKFYLAGPQGALCTVVAFPSGSVGN